MSTDKLKSAKYIRDMARELEKMASEESLHFLSYLFSLAVSEANNLIYAELTSNPEDPSPRE